jgi:hypothetical protein
MNSHAPKRRKGLAEGRSGTRLALLYKDPSSQQERFCPPNSSNSSFFIGKKHFIPSEIVGIAVFPEIFICGSQQQAETNHLPHVSLVVTIMTNMYGNLWYQKYASPHDDQQCPCVRYFCCHRTVPSCACVLAPFTIEPRRSPRLEAINEAKNEAFIVKCGEEGSRRHTEIACMVTYHTCLLPGGAHDDTTPIWPSPEALSYNRMFPHLGYGFPFGEDEETLGGIEYVNMYSPDWVNPLPRRFMHSITIDPSMETVLEWFECEGLLSSENAERVESALVEKGCPPTVPALRAMLQSCPQFLQDLDIGPDICTIIVDAIADKRMQTFRQGREDSQQERDFSLGREIREEIPTPGFRLI